MEVNLEQLKTDLLHAVEESESPQEVLKDDRLKAAMAGIKEVPAEDKAAYGQSINLLKAEIRAAISAKSVAAESAKITPIDVTAPYGVNATQPKRLANKGTIHPISQEMENIMSIFERMGFSIVDSREIDDDYHMFESLNFPDGHPARDHYDTFMTSEGLIAPAHTSTMQNRVLVDNKHKLEAGGQIQVLIPGRVFRNEDLDARHEHTFHQVEGVYVAEGVNVGNLTSTLKEFLETYYDDELEVRTQPFYFPFTEPSLEFALSCPFCKKAGCKVCSQEGWIELLGCGLIHPNVLEMAGIDPDKYTGFAWGFGVERLIMMKNGIEDIRWFNSGNLDFLRQF